MKGCRAIPVAALLLVACASAPGGLQIRDAWARPTAGSSPSAAYLSIRNFGIERDRLIAAKSSCCATIEIHVTRIHEGRMSMTPVTDGLEVAPGETVALEPAGHHLMLFDKCRRTPGHVSDFDTI